MRALGCTCLALALLVACGCARRGPSPNLEGRARETLVCATDIDALSLDPAAAYEFTSTDVCMALYETLVRYEGHDFTRPLPGLAQRWEVSPDALSYTFHLRPEARFPSGRPVDARAVQFSLLRSLRRNEAPAWILQENLEPEGIQVLGPRTLRLRLKHPAAYFLATLFNPVAAVVDPEVVRAHDPDWLREHSAGSGPFVLERWERDVAIVLRRNEAYWGQRPALERVVIKHIPEPTTQQMMLLRGDVDIAYNLSPDQVEALRGDARLRLIEAPLLRVYYLGMNLAFPPLDDERVRMALRCAIDYQGWMGLVRGQGRSLEGPVIEGLCGYQPRLGVYRHDPQRARRLLAQAGWAKGLSLTLYASSGPTPFGLSNENLCARIQSDLARVGVRVEIRTLASATMVELYRAGKCPLVLASWGADYPDAHNFMQPFGHSQGSLARRLAYGDFRLDRLIEAAARCLDEQRRARLYVESQKYLMEHGPYAILAEPRRVLPLRAEVHGYLYNPMSRLDFSRVRKGPP